MTVQVFVGDRVETIQGEIGEVTKIWGVAQSFCTIKRDSDGRMHSMMEKDVSKVIERAADRKSKRGRR